MILLESLNAFGVCSMSPHMQSDELNFFKMRHALPLNLSFIIMLTAKCKKNSKSKTLIKETDLMHIFTRLIAICMNVA